MGRLHTRYAPVRRSPTISASTDLAAPRLACVKPAASVHPEPGSNSPLLVSCFQNSSNCSFTGPGSLFIAGILTGLFYLSLYSSNNFRCFVLWQNFKVLVAILTSSQTSCPAVSFPDCDCKVIAKIRTVQIFTQQIREIIVHTVISI